MSLINVHPDIIIFAFRYALGRRTFAPTIVSEAIKENIDKLNPSIVRAIIREVDEAKDYGDDSDKETWLKLKKFLEKWASSEKEDTINKLENMLKNIKEKDEGLEKAKEFIRKNPMLLSDNNKLVQENIKMFRKSKGMTQEDLSEKSGISRQHLSSIENGKQSITHKALIKIANALEIDIQNFYK